MFHYLFYDMSSILACQKYTYTYFSCDGNYLCDKTNENVHFQFNGKKRQGQGKVG